MKNLEKLMIKPEKLINDKELINLRGGGNQMDCPIETCPSGLIIYWCTCTSGLCLWCGCYESLQAAYQSIDDWCAPPPSGHCFAA